MPLNRHVKRLQHALGCEIIDDNALLHLNRLSRHAEWLRVEAKIKD
jgi:hypothetical protein